VFPAFDLQNAAVERQATAERLSQMNRLRAEDIDKVSASTDMLEALGIAHAAAASQATTSQQEVAHLLRTLLSRDTTPPSAVHSEQAPAATPTRISGRPPKPVVPASNK